MKQAVNVVAAGAVLFWTLQSQGVQFINNGTYEGGFIAMGPSSALDLVPDNVPNGWTRLETFSGGVPESAQITFAADNGPSAPGNTATFFARVENQQQPMSGDWTAVNQALNINAALYSALTLSIDVKVLAHNLEAGGWVNPAFEWPVVAEVDYTDVLGGSQVWRFGWYLTPPGDSTGGPVLDPGQGLIPIYNDMPVGAAVWVANAFNLFAELPQVGTINNIRVGGSGWNYEGLVDNVSLTGVPTGSGVPEAVSTFAMLGLGLVTLGALKRAWAK